MEQPISNIIVGFDFSQQSRQALQTAIEIARTFTATVHVITAIPGHIDERILLAAELEAVHKRDELYPDEALLQALEVRVQHALRALNSAGVKVVVEATRTRPSTAITDSATLHAADLIVVGASGLDAVEDFMLGSVARELVHNSRWAVLVVRANSVWPPARITTAVDFSDSSRRAVGWAGEIAGAYKSQLSVVHVAAAGAKSEDRASVYEQLRKFCTIEDLEGLVVEPLVTGGARADRIILDTAARRDADLLCIGSIGRSGVKGLFVGNTAERILRKSPCSLLVAKPDEFVLDH
jgi:universal stress protein E